MADHDQLFKKLLRTFFPDFLGIVAPDLKAEVCSPEIRFLSQEIFADWPKGRRRQVDLLARMAGMSASFLVHVEVEARFRSFAAQRLRSYFHLLKARHGERVFPVLVTLRGGPPGISRQALEETLGGQLQVFAYTAFGLGGCRAADFLARSEPLAWALAALMHHPDRVELKLACLTRVAGAKLPELETFVLVNCIETYIELRPTEAEAFERRQSAKTQEGRAVQKTWADRMRDEGIQIGLEKGREQGLKQGAEKGARTLLLRLLTQRFGELPSTVRRRVGAIRSFDRLTGLAERVFAVRSLEELGLS